MKIYKDIDGDSGVVAYEYGNDYIRVQFKTGSPYTYNYDSAGRHHIEKMKELADAVKSILVCKFLGYTYLSS